jgi:hypothetical protein
MSVDRTGRVETEAHKSKISRALKAHLEGNQEARQKRSQGASKLAGTPEEKRIRSERLKAIWADPILRAERIKAQINGRALKQPG